jgi:outer membrane protein TolC
MRLTSVIRLLIALALVTPPPAFAAEPAATPQPTPPTILAQAPTPPPPAGVTTTEEPDTSWLPKLEDPPYPGGAIIDSTPPNAIVLSLDDTIQQSLKNNLEIAVRAYDPQQFEGLAMEARAVFDPIASGYVYESSQDSQQSFFLGALFVPANTNGDGDGYGASWFDPLTWGGNYRVDVNIDNSDTDSFQADDPTTPLIDESRTVTESVGSNGWAVTYNQPLLRGLGRNANLWRWTVASNTAQSSQAQFRRSVIDTLAVSEESYWDLNFAIMQLRTSRFALKVAQDFLEQNKVKVRVGTLAPIEITQAEAQVADRNEAVIIAEAGLRAAEDAVRLAIGMRKDAPDWTRPIRPSDPLAVNEVTPSEDEAMQAAMANRPDLEQARLEIASRTSEASAKKNLKRWGLDFSGTYGDLYNSDQGISQNGGQKFTDPIDRTSWRAQLALSVPIGNRSAQAEYARAEADLAQAQSLMAQAEQAARFDVRQAVRQVETTLQRVKAGRVNVRLQAEKLRAEQKKFENGMSTSFQVLTFQDDLFTAKTRENLATDDYNKALVELARAKGTLLVERGIMVQPPGGNPEGAGAAETPKASAAMRRFWSQPRDLYGDPGLKLADAVAEEIRLPADFTWAKTQRGR